MPWPESYVPVVSRSNIFRIFDLRHRVLRAGLPRHSAEFDGDQEPSTWHIEVCGWGAGGTRIPVVCCASLMESEWEDEPAWRLRGMATEPSVERIGLGRLILGYAEINLRYASASRLLWCDAREGAIPFYRKLGWEPQGALFDIPTAGPHVKMTKRI